MSFDLPTALALGVACLLGLAAGWILWGLPLRWIRRTRAHR